MGHRLSANWHPLFCFKTWQICIAGFLANWIITSVFSDKSALTLGVCMDVFRFIHVSIVWITALFSFRKCVNAHIETVCTSIRWLSIKYELSVVWRRLFNCQKSPWYQFVVSGNKVKVADSPCPRKSMKPVSNEPRHDKTNKVTVRPAKTQICLGIRPVWSESSLSAWRKLGSLATH